jgi:hypothetical protein
MADFVVGNTRYRSRLLDGKKQIRILKRMLPVFTALCGVIEQLGPAPGALDAGSEEASPEARPGRTLTEVASMLAPVMQKLSEAPDEDVEYVCDLCMEVTEREARDAKGWVPVTEGGMVMNDEDSSFMNRMTITWYVVGENFESMLASLGVDLKDVMEKAGGLRRPGA